MTKTAIWLVLSELKEFAKEHGLVLLPFNAGRLPQGARKMVHRAAEAALPSKYGNFRAVAYENDLDDLCHVAIVKG